MMACFLKAVSGVYLSFRVADRFNRSLKPYSAGGVDRQFADRQRPNIHCWRRPLGPSGGPVRLWPDRRRRQDHAQ